MFWASHNRFELALFALSIPIAWRYGQTATPIWIAIPILVRLIVSLTRQGSSRDSIGA